MTIATRTGSAARAVGSSRLDRAIEEYLAHLRVERGLSPATLAAYAGDLRSFAIPNLYLTDGSVFPTQGSANPALTIMALAARAADRMRAP